MRMYDSAKFMINAETGSKPIIGFVRMNGGFFSPNYVEVFNLPNICCALNFDIYDYLDQVLTVISRINGCSVH